MGRRGVNSSKGTCRAFKGEKTFDVSAVAPIVLFHVSEKDNQVDKRGSEVMFVRNPMSPNSCSHMGLGLGVIRGRIWIYSKHFKNIKNDRV